MAVREHYIPLRLAELTDVLCADVALDLAERDAFRRWCTLLSATLHFRYQQYREKLKDAYAPFDPDAATVSLSKPTDEMRIKGLDDLFVRIDRILARANFLPIDEATISAATETHSDDGVDLEVDFTAFEKFRVFRRGEAIETRIVRRWWRPWCAETLHVPIHRRLVVIVKPKPGKRLPPELGPDAVHLKYFKDIPQADIEMLLPGARPRMPRTYQLKLGGSLVSGLGLLAVNAMKPLLTTALLGLNYLYTVVIGLLGYGWRQYAGYMTTRTALSLRITTWLYCRNLANNSGVLITLLEEAEEQDARETILAYFHLWRHAAHTGWTAEQLDVSVERHLAALLKADVDFEVDDALAKLVRLGLARKRGDRYVPLPIDAALVHLDRMWDNAFPYSNQAAAAA
jgi:Protein of unknown function (DUF3754)